MKDYYKILHLTPEASDEEIEKAYRQLSEEYKPQEHYPENSYHVRYYKEIQEAFQVLSDPVRRRTYTQELMENQDKIEDLERKQREEGFGDVLKLLLNDPKTNQKAKPKRTTKRIASKSSGDSSIKKPMIIIILVIVLLSIGIFAVLNLDEDAVIPEPYKEAALDEPIEEKDTRSLLEDDLFGSGEKDYDPHNEEEETKDPYVLDEEVSKEMAAYSLQDCFQLLSKEQGSFEKKEDAIARALQFFSGNNANVLVLGKNDVQIRRETIEDYLFILMLQGYDIEVVNTEKDKNGKITQLSVREIL